MGVIVQLTSIKLYNHIVEISEWQKLVTTVDDVFKYFQRRLPDCTVFHVRKLNSHYPLHLDCSHSLILGKCRFLMQRLQQPITNTLMSELL